MKNPLVSGLPRPVLQTILVLLENIFAMTRKKGVYPFPYNALPTAFSKKWTFDLPMKRAASRRHVFETHVNWFALIFQLHRTKPVNHLAQEASIRQR